MQEKSQNKCYIVAMRKKFRWISSEEMGGKYETITDHLA
jgi:hypothetical protein